MYTISYDYREFDRQKWTEFLDTHPNGNIFHSPGMVDLYNSSSNREPIVIACFNESKEFTGILVAEIQREYGRILGNLTARAIVFGGPLAKDNDPVIASLLIEAFNKICNKRVLYSQFRNLWDISLYDEAFCKLGYVFEEHLDIITDLTLSEAELYKKIASNGRNKINKAKRAGTIVTPIEDRQLLKKSYAILDEVYKKVKLPLPRIHYFENAWDLLFPLGHIKYFGAFNDNKLIGVRIELIFNNTIYDWYAGSQTEHYDKYPNDILPWDIIKWGSENGYKKFDFGGAGRPDKPYGVRDFKMKYGGTLVNYGRFEKIHKPFLMAFARVAFRLWKLFYF